MGPPKTRNSCHAVIRNRIAHAVYCMMLNALVTNGKYSSITVISVPKVSRNIPEIESITCATMLLIQ